MKKSKPEEVTMREEKLESLITEFCEAYDDEDPTAKAWLLKELTTLFQQKLDNLDNALRVTDPPDLEGLTPERVWMVGQLAILIKFKELKETLGGRK